MITVFLIDPLETLRLEKDTSWALMVAALRRGHTVYVAGEKDITLENGIVNFSVYELTLNKGLQTRGPRTMISANNVNVVWIRWDPPFDDLYLANTWLLDHLPHHVSVLNHPTGIRTAQEKLWVTQFTTLTPPTTVTQSMDIYLSFLSTHQKVVLKPLHGHGAKGIFIVPKNDPNATVIFESMSENGPIILQAFVKAASEGDKRILLFDGQPLGAMLRIHLPGEYRNNLAAGGTAHPAQITARDQEIIHKIQPHLLRLGLRFVGIDILGDCLTEVNVTSPTCLQEINRFNNCVLEDPIWNALESEQRRPQ